MATATKNPPYEVIMKEEMDQDTRKSLNHFISLIIKDENNASGFAHVFSHKVTSEDIRELDAEEVVEMFSDNIDDETFNKTELSAVRKQFKNMFATVGIGLAYELNAMPDDVQISDLNEPRVILLCTDKEKVTLNMLNKLIEQDLKFEDIKEATIISGGFIQSASESDLKQLRSLTKEQ